MNASWSEGRCTATQDGIWVVDADGRTLYANRRLAELLGRPMAEMKDPTVFDALDEAGQAQFADL